MRVLITRSHEDAAGVAALAQGHHLDPVLASLIDVVFSTAAVPLAGIGALAFTSANGVRAFVQNSERRDLPVFAVGEVTAQQAHAEKFTTVYTAGGDVQSLARLVIEKQTQRTDVLHIAGTHRAGDLATLLKEDHIPVRRLVLYEAKAVTTLPDTAAAFLKEPREHDWVSFFSPRTARLFCDLVEKAGLVDHLSRQNAVCLSETVAAEVHHVGWRAVRISAARNAQSLIDAICRQ